MTLLSKLDRRAEGIETHCEIQKFQHPDNPPEYMQTMAACSVVAVPDEFFYANRNFGEVHPFDDPAMTPEEREKFLTLFFSDRGIHK